MLQVLTQANIATVLCMNGINAVGEQQIVQHTCGWQHVLDEHEDGLLGADLDPLANDVNELTHSEISWNQVPASHRHVQVQEPPASFCKAAGRHNPKKDGRMASLFLVYVRNVTLLCLLHDNLYASCPVSWTRLVCTGNMERDNC